MLCGEAGPDDFVESQSGVTVEKMIENVVMARVARMAGAGDVV